MFRRLMSTDDSKATALLRVALGIVFFAHGSQKVFGWFDGPGFNGALAYFASLHVPTVFALIAIAAEFLGSLGLIFGLLSRVAALGIAGIMIVAVALVHIHFGFFMNWHGKQAGEGIEYHLLVLTMTIFLMIRGGGALSLDRSIHPETQTRKLHASTLSTRTTAIQHSRFDTNVSTSYYRTT